MIFLKDYDQILTLRTLRGRIHQESRSQMLALFLLSDKGPSSIASQLYILPGQILLTIDISTNSWFHLSLLIGHTRTLLYHKHAMQLNSQRDLLPHFLKPNLHKIILFCFKYITILISIRHFIELSSSKTHEC